MSSRRPRPPCRRSRYCARRCRRNWNIPSSRRSDQAMAHVRQSLEAELPALVDRVASRLRPG